MTTLLNLRALERRAEVLRRFCDGLDRQIDEMVARESVAPRTLVFLKSLVVGEREAARSLELAAEYWKEAHRLHFGFPPEVTARPELRIVGQGDDPPRSAA